MAYLAFGRRPLFQHGLLHGMKLDPEIRINKAKCHVDHVTRFLPLHTFFVQQLTPALKMRHLHPHCLLFTFPKVQLDTSFRVDASCCA